MEREGKMVAAGFLYLSNSPISHLEWLISDPREKGLPIHKLVKALVDRAINSGCPLIMTNFDNEQKTSASLINLYKHSGFEVVGGNMTMMVNKFNYNIESFFCEDKCKKED